MQLFGRQYRVDWGHFATVSVMTLASVWYLLDARSVSLSINNLILVQPTAILVVLLYLFILPQCFTAEPVSGSVVEPVGQADAPPPLTLEGALRVGGLAVSLLLYGLIYETIGFDVASFLFLAITTYICGERRPVPLLIFAALGTVFLVYAVHFLVPVPVPTTFI